jgi:2-amino-4-hydroxy-6-hydroxymethyldihydropteridine diphosphokinase
MAVAPCYESDAVGGPADQPPYLNAVLRIATILTPSELLTLIHDIETALGRRRTTPNAPRAIDLDILLYDDRILDSASLTIPHPRMSDRAFVLRPLADIAPDRRHPILHQSIGELLVALGPEALQSCHPVAFALRIPSRAPR